ncbi:MAG: excinuclease ABC subunit UvrA [Candidatus Krumholzibacteria bacterium]|nr:excinuclease ABC subunit UvrA [Candidatus Krumholzibacteria bacterium]
MDTIVIRGARQHNLKNVDLELPRRTLIVITGVSGSGKSSLAFDTIFAEGQRRYIESLSTYARQFIEKLERPDVDDISGLSPTIAIRQKNTVTSARSTVGTATEIYDYIRLLFARVGRIVCPRCRLEVRSHSPSDAAQEIIRLFGGKRINLLMPLGAYDAAGWKTRRGYLLSRGYSRLLVGGEAVRLEELAIEKGVRAEIAVLLDRIEAVEANRSRIAEVVELAYRESSGSIEIAEVGGGATHRFTQAPLCSSCGASFETPTPLLFSFNSPYGACPDCHGFGDRMEFSEDLIIPDRRLSIEKLAIDPWSRERFAYFQHRLIEFCRAKRIPLGVPWMDLPGESRKLILDGEGKYLGVIPFLEKLREKSYKKGHRFFTRKYMAFTTCRTCEGGRLKREAYNVRVGDFTIRDLVRMVPARTLEAIEGTRFTEQERRIARDILSEIASRLRFMIDVGLGYITLDRLTRTLSGGEAQRINLANSLGANLVDALYILDEPSIGLHAADNERLVAVLGRLRDLGNTVLVVEHDPDIIRSCDYLVDLGPGPGSLGGEVLFSGTIEQARSADVPKSKTLEWLFRGRPGAVAAKKRRRQYGSIELTGVAEHNLKNVDVSFPLGLVTCVTGVSGSGKSSLVVDVLYPVVSGDPLSASRLRLRGCDVRGKLDRVLLVDQSPIGSSPRSNPITYIKGFSFIREIFASQQAARMRGYDPGRFSFNKSGGRCPRCQGMGFRRVEMHFMADVFVPCEECEGRRYNAETLEVRYKGMDISEVLAMTVDDAIRFFDAAPQLGEKLWILSKVGLGYLTLGQPSNTLSGGEAQRTKIARELAESAGQRNLYIMDEPTTGLHMSDVDRLLAVFEELVTAGHTVVVIEHNMEVIAWSDCVIDLGPGGGGEGGTVIACGPPESIVQSETSLTGKYLGAYLERYGGRTQ